MSTNLRIDWDNRSATLTDIPAPLSPRLVLWVNYRGFLFSGEKLMFLMPDDRTAQVTVNPVDSKGFAAPVENLVFSSSDEAVVTVDAVGVITPVGLGIATVNVTADAQIGDGVTTIAGMLEVQVIAGQAVSLAVVATLL